MVFKAPNVTTEHIEKPLRWDKNEHALELALRMPVTIKRDELLDLKIRQISTFMARIRQLGERDWSVGFETPLKGCTFRRLKPNTEYEIELRAIVGDLEGEPALLTAQTNEDGRIFGEAVAEPVKLRIPRPSNVQSH